MTTETQTCAVCGRQYPEAVMHAITHMDDCRVRRLRYCPACYGDPQSWGWQEDD